MPSLFYPRHGLHPRINSQFVWPPCWLLPHDHGDRGGKDYRFKLGYAADKISTKALTGTLNTVTPSLSRSPVVRFQLGTLTARAGNEAAPRPRTVWNRRLPFGEAFLSPISCSRWHPPASLFHPLRRHLRGCRLSYPLPRPRRCRRHLRRLLAGRRCRRRFCRCCWCCWCCMWYRCCRWWWFPVPSTVVLCGRRSSRRLLCREEARKDSSPRLRRPRSPGPTRSSSSRPRRVC